MLKPCSSEMRMILQEFLSDQCLLTTKNQHTLCCYWNITEGCKAKMILQMLIDEECREAIRLTWHARALFDVNYQILPVTFTSGHEYLDVPFAHQSYQAEIGWIRTEGEFISILTSNRSEVV